MTTDDYLLILAIASVLFFSSVVYATVGFGFGLFANPLLLLCGLPLPMTMATVTTSMSLSSLVSLSKMRDHIQWRPLVPVLVAAMVTLPLGTFVLREIASLDKAQMRAVFGGILLGVLALQRWMKVQPRERVHTGWGLAAGTACGIIAGTAGVGGPPVVLWAMAHRWTGLQLRATLWVTFICLVPFQLTMLCMMFGAVKILPYALMGLYGLPCVLAGSAVGMRLGNLLPIRQLRAGATVLLVLLAVALLVGPLMPAAVDPINEASATVTAD